MQELVNQNGDLEHNLLLGQLIIIIIIPDT